MSNVMQPTIKFRIKHTSYGYGSPGASERIEALIDGVWRELWAGWNQHGEPHHVSYRWRELGLDPGWVREQLHGVMRPAQHSGPGDLYVGELAIATANPKGAEKIDRQGDFTDEDGDCTECGFPADGSAGHGGPCQSPAHRS